MSHDGPDQYDKPFTPGLVVDITDRIPPPQLGSIERAVLLAAERCCLTAGELPSDVLVVKVADLAEILTRSTQLRGARP